MNRCGYCGHPPEDHIGDGCCGDARGFPPSRWRTCRCTTYRPPEEAP